VSDALTDVFRKTIIDGERFLGAFVTEYSANTFPALPVREGENVFVWFSRFTGPAALSAHRDALVRCADWHARVRPALLAMLTGEPQQLTLAPTPRSLLY